jgi:hypothetical protein
LIPARTNNTMPQKTPSATIDTSITREQVEAIVEGKLKFYKTVVYAFALGLTSLFILLTANQLLSNRPLLVYLHDQIFGSDRALSELIDKSVALSYSDQFALKAQDKPRNLYFYANKQQKVVIVLAVEHSGPTKHNSKLLVTLDQFESPIFDSPVKLEFSNMDITDKTSAPVHFAPGPENVHCLTFQVDPKDIDPNDQLSIRIITNVSGLETKENDNMGKKVNQKSETKENEK